MDLTANVQENTPEPHKRDTLRLLFEFQDCFSADKDDIGRTDILQHEIDLDTDKPIFIPQFRLSTQHFAAIKDQLAAWIRQCVTNNIACILIGLRGRHWQDENLKSLVQDKVVVEQNRDFISKFVTKVKPLIRGYGVNNNLLNEPNRMGLLSSFALISYLTINKK